MPYPRRSINLIPSYYYNVLKENKTSALFKYEPYWKNDWRPGAFDNPWYEDFLPYRISFTDTYMYYEKVDFLYSRNLLCLVKNIKKKSDSYYIISLYNKVESYDRSYFSEDYRIMSAHKYFRMYLKYDGDYVTVYAGTPDNSLGTFVISSYTVYSSLRDIAAGKKVDLSKIAWPRHADGTCDYDGSGKPAVKTSVQLSAGMTKSVYTNLRLRSTEDTSSTVITTMQKGTSVKIIKTGGQDTIDGITSDWVQVEVQAGAKDRDGKIIKTGTTGWCFGGYLE